MKKYLTFLLLLPFAGIAQSGEAVFYATHRLLADLPAVTALPNAPAGFPSHTVAKLGDESLLELHHIFPGGGVKVEKMKLYRLAPSDVSVVTKSKNLSENGIYSFNIGRKAKLYSPDSLGLSNIRRSFVELTGMGQNEFPASASAERKKAITKVLKHLNENYQVAYRSYDWHFQKMKDVTSGRKTTHFFSKWTVKGDSLVFNSFGGYFAEAYKCQIFSNSIAFPISELEEVVQDSAKGYIRLAQSFKTVGRNLNRGNGGCNTEGWNSIDFRKENMFLTQSPDKSRFVLAANVPYSAKEAAKLNKHLKVLGQR